MKKTALYFLLLLLTSTIGLFVLANKDSNSTKAITLAPISATPLVSKPLTPLKVLYVTHDESSKHHDYVGQHQVFESIATEQGWDYSILAPKSKGLIQTLEENTDFAKGYDVVVYNFCVAGSKNLKAVANVINQTKKLHVDALLIHGSMHSFFPTYSKRLYERLDEEALKNLDLVSVGIGEGVADAKLVKKWENANPNEEFPIWGDFCGAASEKHARHLPVKIHKLRDHESAKSVIQDYTISKSELYLNLYKTDNLIEILEGTTVETNPEKEVSATVLWERPYEKASVMGLSLGHFLDEWKTPEFQALLVHSIEYLAN